MITFLGQVMPFHVKVCKIDKRLVVKLHLTLAKMMMCLSPLTPLLVLPKPPLSTPLTRQTQNTCILSEFEPRQPRFVIHSKSSRAISQSRRNSVHSPTHHFRRRGQRSGRLRHANAQFVRHHLSQRRSMGQDDGRTRGRCFARHHGGQRRRSRFSRNTSIVGSPRRKAR